MTLFNRIAFGLIALVAVVVVVGVLAVGHFDLTRQKQRIETSVFEKTGRQLQINGELNASLFPWFGLSLSDISMGNAKEFGDAEFATVKTSDLKLAFLPVLAGRIEIEKISLQGLSLKLQRNADGKTNWDDLMATSAVVETESDDNVMREIEAGAPIIAALSVGDVQITESNISYSDGRDESYLALNELNLSTGRVALSEPFEFESDFNFISSAASGLTSVVGAKGEIAIDLINNIYVLQELKLSTVNSGAALPLDPLAVSLNGELVADLNAQSIDITVVDGLLSGIPVSGEFHATELEDDLRLSGMLASGEFDATPLIDQLDNINKEQLPSEMLQSAQVTARFEHIQDVLQIREFEASIGDVELNGDFQIANPSGSGVFSGWLQTNPFDPAPWARSVGMELSDSTVMRLAQLSADVRQSGQLLSFNQIDLQLDESNITGSIEVSDINSDNLPVTYALAVDRINLDKYLTNNLLPATDGARRQVPVDALRRLSLDGEVTFAELTLGAMTAQNAVVPLVAENGKLVIAEAIADLYSGSFFTTASLDVQADEPLLSVTGNLNGLNADALLQDVLNKESPLTGIGNLSIDLLSRGREWSQLIEHANGAVSLRVTEGLLKGIDISEKLRYPDGLRPQSLQDLIPSTDFSEYSLSGVLADGLLKSDDLIFSSADLQLTGEGGVNLNAKSMDYLLHLVVTSNPPAEQNESQQDLLGAEFIIPVSGSFSDPKVNFPEFVFNAFQSGLTREIKALDSGLDLSASESQRQALNDRITLEKEALRLRLEAEQQNATEITRDKKQQGEPSTEEALRQLELEREKNALKDQLQNNLKNNLNGLLGEN